MDFPMQIWMLAVESPDIFICSLFFYCVLEGKYIRKCLALPQISLLKYYLNLGITTSSNIDSNLVSFQKCPYLAIWFVSFDSYSLLTLYVRRSTKDRTGVCRSTRPTFWLTRAYSLSGDTDNTKIIMIQEKV